MNKVALRNKFNEVRNKTSDKELKSKQIANKVMELEAYKKARVIALYSSLPCEVDTSILITQSLITGKTVALPKVIRNTELKFYSINSYEELNTIGAFGIKEPSYNIDTFIPAENIDLIIVPGICFDSSRNRIGFGKGYYDKYMSGDFKVTKIGICFDEQVLKNECIPIDEFDVKMDMVITDKLTY